MVRAKHPESVLLGQEPVLSRDQMIYRLRKHRVSRAEWGTKTYRTFGDLMNYHERDKLFVRNGTSDRFIIDVHVAVILVVHKYKGQWLELYEAYQEFPDGHTLSRDNFNGIAETAKREESMVKSAQRCLAEELNFHDPAKYELSRCLKVENWDPIPSEKWPGGVWSSFHRHIFECTIQRSLFLPDGYMEQEKNRKIFFKWRPRKQLALAL